MIHLLCTFVLRENFTIGWDGNYESVTKGETVLLPAMIKEVTLKPSTEAKLLEIYINSEISL